MLEITMNLQLSERVLHFSSCCWKFADYISDRPKSKRFVDYLPLSTYCCFRHTWSSSLQIFRLLWNYDDAAIWHNRALVDSNFKILFVSEREDYFRHQKGATNPIESKQCKYLIKSLGFVERSLRLYRRQVATNITGNGTLSIPSSS